MHSLIKAFIDHLYLIYPYVYMLYVFYECMFVIFIWYGQSENALPIIVMYRTLKARSVSR